MKSTCSVAIEDQQVWPLKPGDTVYFKTIPPGSTVVKAEFVSWIHKNKGFVWMAECRTSSGNNRWVRDYSLYVDENCTQLVATIKEAAMPEVNWN